MRILNKLRIKRLGKRFEKIYLLKLSKSFSNEQLVSMIGDKSHKLLQEALGQNIESNQYFLSVLIKEAFKRKIDSKIVNWANQTYNDFLKGELYKDKQVENPTNNKGIYNLNTFNAYFNIISKRQSIRKFKQDEISNEIIEYLIKCGIEAPSSCNRQSWRFITFTKKTDQQFISKIRNVKFLANSPLIICVLINNDFYAFYGKKDQKITPYMDASAAIMNILNACSALDLGSCWVNFIASVTEKRIKEFKEYFNIPKKYVPFSLIAIGHTDQKIQKPLRDGLNKYWIGKH